MVAVDEGFAVDVVPSGDGWRIVLTGDIDVAAHDALRAAIAKTLARTASHVVIDLSATTFLDSTGINGLVLAYKAAEAADVRLVVEPGPPTVMKALRIAGIDRLLGIDDGDG
jgi:anti-sigma B factor antagonist